MTMGCSMKIIKTPNLEMDFKVFFSSFHKRIQRMFEQHSNKSQVLFMQQSVYIT